MKKYSQTVWALAPTEFEALLNISSQRELSDKMRRALRIRYEHGHALESTAAMADVSRVTLSAAEDRLLTMHKHIVQGYLERR